MTSVSSSGPAAGSAKRQVWFPDTSALVTLAVHLPLQRAVVATLSAHWLVLVKSRGRGTRGTGHDLRHHSNMGRHGTRPAGLAW